MIATFLQPQFIIQITLTDDVSLPPIPGENYF